MNNVMQVPDIIRGVEPECVQLIQSHKSINIQAEMNYATQLLLANDYSANIARQNPISVQNALRNASAIGISLNPAGKHAYLVPRSGSICLDISYMGLLHLAMSTGSIEWGQSKLVYEADFYENQGIDKAPVHKCNSFGDRGSVVGAYCTVKTSTGAYLTEEMNIAQLNAIKGRSESGKKNKGPWVTDFDEMCRKTVVKRASKYWPKVDRLNHAIDYLNSEGDEGIESDEVVKDVTPIQPETADWLNQYRDNVPPEALERFDRWLGMPVSELTEESAQSAIQALTVKSNGGVK